MDLLLLLCLVYTHPVLQGRMLRRQRPQRLPLWGYYDQVVEEVQDEVRRGEVESLQEEWQQLQAEEVVGQPRGTGLMGMRRRREQMNEVQEKDERDLEEAPEALEVMMNLVGDLEDPHEDDVVEDVEEFPPAY